MALKFYKPEPIKLKGHTDFNEKWVQQRIVDDPSLLGLDDAELVGTEKSQPKAGRLDLLLHDELLNRRYEVELMLGATDPSHILRTIEYLDIERRRYPAYQHVGVIVAEDITSRFLNLISLLAGSIPLIAIQMSALRVDDKVVLHFTRVLDLTDLRSDDEWELGEKGGNGIQVVDRNWWQQRVPANILGMSDDLLALVNSTSGITHQMQYRKRIINFVSDKNADQRTWLTPKQTLARFGAYVRDAEGWAKRFEDVGLVASLRRGNKAATVAITPAAFQEKKQLLTDFVRDSFAEEESEPMA